MVIRCFLLALLMAVSSLPCLAQSPVNAEMDKIKLDEKYIYGEYYDDDKDMAYQNALDDLLSSINEIREDEGKAPLKVSDIQTIVKELKYANGTRYVSFLYMTLNQALSLTPKSTDNVTATPPSASGVTKPENDGNKVTQNNTGSTPPQNQGQSSGFTFVPNQGSSDSSAAAVSGKDILEVICGQDNWTEIKNFIISFKQQGKIRQNGNCMSFAEVPDDAYSILMDEQGGILAVLSPKNSSVRINHRTNKADNETNHSNCKFIVWYK